MRKGPPVEKYKTGPNCGDCPYRTTSTGFAFPQAPKGAEVMFVSEHLDYDEVLEGTCVAGAKSSTLNRLMREQTGIRRSEQHVTSLVKCRPIEWMDGQPLRREYNNDHIVAKPSLGQVRECATRYFEKELAEFNGQIIVGHGPSPLHYFVGQSRKITDYRGTIFEPGEKIECAGCLGSGVECTTVRKCHVCKGKGSIPTPTGLRCEKHNYEGLRPSKRKCELCISCVVHNLCTECAGTCSVPGRSKVCKTCSGEGRVQVHKSAFISDKLKPGQKYFPTYALDYLFKNPTKWPVLEKDFARIEHLDEELKYEHTGVDYLIYPSTEQALYRVSTAIAENRPLSLDIEGPSAKTWEGAITVVGISDGPGKAMALDVENPAWTEALKGKVIGQNFVLYDAWVLANRGYPIPPYIWDTRFAGHLLNPDTPNDLVYLTSEFADPPIRGFWKTEQNYAEKIQEVVSLDVDATYRVYEGQRKKLEETGQIGLMEDDIIPLSQVILDMRLRGMRVDKERMEEAAGKIGSYLEEKRKEFPEGIESENQHAKIKALLYDTWGLPPIYDRKTGKPSTGSDALGVLQTGIRADDKKYQKISEEIKEEALRFIELKLHLTELSKLKSSFLSYRLSGNSFAHPALNPAGTATLRFSCSNPNAQQVPGDTCGGQCMGKDPKCLGARYIFLPDEPGWEIMSADLSQAEVVGFLWYAEQWDVLRDVLVGGMDAHQMLANKILGRDATKAERGEFKNTTFALLFGEHETTTARRLNRPIEEIQEARAMYFKMLPGVREWREKTIYDCMDRGYVQSAFGVRRYIRVESPVGRAANQACNSPIQNIPPMVTRRVMRALNSTLPSPARLLMQVHDEILLTYPKEMRKIVHETVRDEIRKPIPELFGGPIGMGRGIIFNTDIEVGDSWGSLGPIEK